ncbi:uncharacterized protein LOC106641639 [Copidosoma floridanum]|uniref:uncharacterized protein LOC106641639 n=1 Tax=Copidosoma floridanum TaxID=29053 RepID=UPI0006C95BC2|nr:uncharacterized protein LOC106641639 [Copidosoma floridanum]
MVEVVDRSDDSLEAKSPPASVDNMNSSLKNRSDEVTDSCRRYLHDLAARPRDDSTAKVYIKNIENYLDESDAHEINERDYNGRTALHVAVQQRNVDAVVALLLCGADINVGDLMGKSSFTYLLDTFQPSSYKGNSLFFTLHGHVHKLLALGLEVSEENRRCYGVARVRHAFNDKQLQIGYELELDKMKDVNVARGTSLCDVLFNGAQAIATSMLKRRTLEEIITASDFYTEFPKLCCLITLQYRRGLTRRKMMEPAKVALEEVIGLSLPDPCTEGIILHLGEDDLMNLIMARTMGT